VIAINGESCVGFTMQQAAGLVMKSTSAELTVRRKGGGGAAAAAAATDSAAATAKQAAAKKAVLVSAVEGLDAKEAAGKKTAMLGAFAAALAEVEQEDATVAASEAEVAPQPPRTIVLDRSNGKQLGIRLGNAAGADQGVPIIEVDPDHQAHGLLTVDEVVTEINGVSVVGMSFQAAAELIMQKDSVEFTVQNSGDAAIVRGVSYEEYQVGSISPPTTPALGEDGGDEFTVHTSSEGIEVANAWDTGDQNPYGIISPFTGAPGIAMGHRHSVANIDNAD